MSRALFAFQGLLVAANAATASQSSHVAGRKLDTLDVINQLLADFEINVEQDVDLGAGNTLDFIRCKGFSIGGLDTTSSLDVSVSPELEEVVIKASDFAFECSIRIKSLFGISTTEKATSRETTLTVPLDFHSEKFGYLIPTSVEVSPGSDCAKDMFSLDLELGSFIGGLIDVETIATNALCPTLTGLLTNVTRLLSDNILIDLAGTRVEQADSILDLIPAAEEKIASLLPANFTFYDAAAFEQVKTSFVDEFFESPLVVDVSFLGFQLVQALAEDDIELAADLLEQIIKVMFEVDVEIPVEKLEEIIDSGILDDLGNLTSLIDIDMLATAGIEIVTSLFDSLPEDVQSILAPLEQMIIEFLEGLISEADSRRLQEITIDLTVGDVLRVVPCEEQCQEILSRAGITSETPVTEAILLLVDGITLEDLTEIFELPEGMSLEDLLPFATSESTIREALQGLNDIITSVSMDLSSYFQDGFYITVSDPVPESVMSVLEILAAQSTQVAEIYNQIEANGGTLEVFAAKNPLIEIPLATLGNITIGFFSFGFDLSFSKDNTLMGRAGESSFVFPEFSLEELLVKFGISVKIDKNSVILLDDVVEFSFSFNVDTQEAITTGFAFINLIEFEFTRMTSVLKGLKVMADYAMCGISSTGFGVSAHKTVMDLLSDLVSVNDGLSGFFEDLINTFLGMYAPAVPTLGENSLFGLTEFAPFLSTDFFVSRCYFNQNVVIEDGGDGGSDGGDGGPTTGGTTGTPGSNSLFGDGISSAAVVASVVSVAVVMIAVVVAMIFKGSVATAAKDPNAAERQAKTAASILEPEAESTKAPAPTSKADPASL